MGGIILGDYDVQQVCLNGHQITDRFFRSSEIRKKYCNKCGAPTIHQCPKCGQVIPGEYIVEGVFNFGHETPVPEFCNNCGAPFPWIENKAEITQAVAEESANPLNLVEHICSRFHLVAKQLRDRYRNRNTLDIEDEYDVQNLLHALLRLFFDDIRPEEWTPSYAGACSRVDFLLKPEQIVIEVKKTRKGLAAKEVGEQLIIDIARYKKHPDCKTLFCFVYDPDGRISNPQGIENDLACEEDGFCVKVFIVPKGY